jgi:copper chaperone CopZ
VASILEKCPGVKSVKVDAMKSTATVNGDPNMKVDDLLNALSQSGSYRGSVIK